MDNALKVAKEEKEEMINTALATCDRFTDHLDGTMTDLRSIVVLSAPVHQQLRLFDTLLDRHYSYLEQNNNSIPSETVLAEVFQIQLVSQELLGFEIDIHGYMNILTLNRVENYGYRSELLENLRSTMQAVSLEALNQIPIRSPEWLNTNPGARSIQFQNTWNEIHLHERIMQHMLLFRNALGNQLVD